MSKQFYFITGLPRCRSAWFANYLTWGDSFCLHDGFVGRPTIEAMVEHLRFLPAKQVGNSDPANVFAWRQLKVLCPDAKWVVVRRPWLEALESSRKAFGATNLLLYCHLQAEIDSLVADLKPLMVDFHALEPLQVAEWLDVDTGGEARTTLLNRLNVQIDAAVLKAETPSIVNNPPAWLLATLKEAA